MMLSYASNNKCKSSDFHKTCIPAEARLRAQESQRVPNASKGDRKALSDTQIAKLDIVSQDAIWTERVVQEKSGNAAWNTNWGFLNDYDAQGNETGGRLKSARKLPSRVNMYSDSVPNTQAGQYGSRIYTEAGSRIQSLDAKFMTDYRKEKLDGEMVCY